MQHQEKSNDSNDWKLHALRDYFREYNASDRSSNIDATNHTLSVLDEFEAGQVVTFLAKEGRAAGSVWGDIYRNKFISSVRNPPAGLTPDDNGSFHRVIKVGKLKASCLESTLHAPEIKNKKASTVEDSSALISMSLKGN